LDVSKTSLDKAKAALTGAILTSPISGTVISSTVTTGQVLSASTVVYEIVDLSSLHVDVNVGETDISKIKENMPVALNLDGIPNRSFTGKVTFIASKAVVTSNVVNYSVTVTLDQGTANSLVEAYPTEFAKLLQRPNGGANQARNGGANQAAAPGAATTPGGTPAATGANAGTGTGTGAQLPKGASAALATSTGICGYTLNSAFNQGAASAEQPKVGMTANVTFCLDLKAGVLSVPNRAIKTHTVGGQRSSYVTVLVDAATNKTEDRNIVTGLAGDSYTEITGGNIKDGDLIVLSTTPTNRATTGGGGAGGFGGGGGPVQVINRGG
jgi:multidrug efflux pump subunit AcrA (membrane-fusion protein)